MENKLVTTTILTLLIGIVLITVPLTPTSASPAEPHMTRWKLIEIENPTGGDITGNFEISVSPSKVGIHIAGSTDISYYCADPTAWLEYTNWTEWLFGNETLQYHWDWMDRWRLLKNS